MAKANNTLFLLLGIGALALLAMGATKPGEEIIPDIIDDVKAGEGRAEGGRPGAEKVPVPVVRTSKVSITKAPVITQQTPLRTVMVRR